VTVWLGGSSDTGWASTGADHAETGGSGRVARQVALRVIGREERAVLGVRPDARAHDYKEVVVT